MSAQIGTTGGTGTQEQSGMKDQSGAADAAIPVESPVMSDIFPAEIPSPIIPNTL